MSSQPYQVELICLTVLIFAIFPLKTRLRATRSTYSDASIKSLNVIEIASWYLSECVSRVAEPAVAGMKPAVASPPRRCDKAAPVFDRGQSIALSSPDDSALTGWRNRWHGPRGRHRARCVAMLAGTPGFLLGAYRPEMARGSLYIDTLLWCSLRSITPERSLTFGRFAM